VSVSNRREEYVDKSVKERQKDGGEKIELEETTHLLRDQGFAINLVITCRLHNYRHPTYTRTFQTKQSLGNPWPCRRTPPTHVMLSTHLPPCTFPLCYESISPPYGYSAASCQLNPCPSKDAPQRVLSSQYITIPYVNLHKMAEASPEDAREVIHPNDLIPTTYDANNAFRSASRPLCGLRSARWSTRNRCKGTAMRLRSSSVP